MFKGGNFRAPPAAFGVAVYPIRVFVCLYVHPGMCADAAAATVALVVRIQEFGG